MKKAKIAVIGSYAVGMTISCDHFPVRGETVPGNNFEMMHGGKGSNQAVGAARLGAEVLYGGCVGNDAFGDMCLDLYKQEQMDTACICRSQKGLSTGVGLIYVDRHGENEIVIDLAANKEFAPANIDAMMPQIKTCDLVLMQLEMSLETVLYTAKKCQENGITFVLNPAPYQALPAKLLEYCDYLTPNQTEARLLLGLATDDPISDVEVGEQLREMGVKNVVMTLGSQGALYLSQTKCEVIPGIKVDVVDTTGAGDTFSAAFSVALAEGKTVEEAIGFGNIAAGLAVTKYGVVESIPYRKTVDQYKENKTKGGERI